MMDSHETHDDYYEWLKDKCERRIAQICGMTEWERPMTRSDIMRCECYAHEYGDKKERADVRMLVTEWLHAYHELCEHHHAHKAA